MLGVIVHVLQSDHGPDLKTSEPKVNAMQGPQVVLGLLALHSQQKAGTRAHPGSVLQCQRLIPLFHYAVQNLKGKDLGRFSDIRRSPSGNIIELVELLMSNINGTSFVASWPRFTDSSQDPPKLFKYGLLAMFVLNQVAWSHIA